MDVGGERDGQEKCRQESLRALVQRYGINQKTVAKRKSRTFCADRPTGPKDAKSMVLSPEEAIIVAFRRLTLLPFDGLPPSSWHIRGEPGP